MNPVRVQIYLVIALFLFSVCGVAVDVVNSSLEQVQEKKEAVVLLPPASEYPELPELQPLSLVTRKNNEFKKIVVRQVKATNKNAVKEHIVKYSIDMNVDPALALAIAKTESNFEHHKRSSQGAVGIFQILPSTARSMGYNAYSEKENIKGGITYYKKMFQKFGNMELALAAYNAGPGNVKRYNGVPPFAETQRYINKIKVEYEKHKNDPLIEKYQNGQM